MRTITLLEFHARIMEIMKILEFHENHRIPHENHNNHEDSRIPSDNHKNLKKNHFYLRIFYNKNALTVQVSRAAGVRGTMKPQIYTLLPAAAVQKQHSNIINWSAKTKFVYWLPYKKMVECVQRSGLCESLRRCTSLFLIAPIGVWGEEEEEKGSWPHAFFCRSGDKWLFSLLCFYITFLSLLCRSR